MLNNKYYRVTCLPPPAAVKSKINIEDCGMRCYKITFLPKVKELQTTVYRCYFSKSVSAIDIDAMTDFYNYIIQVMIEQGRAFDYTNFAAAVNEYSYKVEEISVEEYNRSPIELRGYY